MRSTLMVLTFCLWFCACSQPAQASPNVIIFLSDDMGYGDPKCLNPQSRIPTPNIDLLSRQGMTFTDAHTSSSICTPSRYGLMTGRYCWRSKLPTGIVWYWDMPFIDPNRLTMAGMFKQHGYATACVGKWHLGMDWPLDDGSYISDHETAVLMPPKKREAYSRQIDFRKPIHGGPLAYGFDYYFGTAVPNFPPYCFIENDRTVGIPALPKPKDMFGRSWGPMIEGWQLEKILPTMTDKAVAYIDEHAATKKGQPFFMYFASTAPHTPIRPDKPFQGKSDAGPYGDLVHQVDWTFGQILRALDRNGLADNTIVVFTSDNGSPQRAGDPFLHGSEDFTLGAVKKMYGHNPSYNYRGMKWNIWDGGHRVPFIVRWPGKVKAGSMCRQTVCLTDWMRTFAGLIGHPLPKDAGEDSYNIMPLLMGQTDNPIREATVHHSSMAGPNMAIGNGFAIRQGQWKLIHGVGPHGRVKERVKDLPSDHPIGELYDIQADPGEQNNLWNDRQDVVERLVALLEKYQREGRSVAVDHKTLKRSVSRR
ncbi:MAG: arylsulfatase [Phycisphaeraceae bacterium]|nr:arylsulfatase [Phycisphaeraceae bacterium]